MIPPEPPKKIDKAARYREAIGLQINRKINTMLGGWRRCGHGACRRAKYCCGTPLQCVVKRRQRPPPTQEQRAKNMSDFRKKLEQRIAEARAQDPDYGKVPRWKRPNGGIMTPEEFAEWARERRAEQTQGKVRKR